MRGTKVLTRERINQKVALCSKVFRNFLQIRTTSEGKYFLDFINVSSKIVV